MRAFFSDQFDPGRRILYASSIEGVGHFVPGTVAVVGYKDRKVYLTPMNRAYVGERDVLLPLWVRHALALSVATKEGNKSEHVEHVDVRLVQCPVEPWASGARVSLELEGAVDMLPWRRRRTPWSLPLSSSSSSSLPLPPGVFPGPLGAVLPSALSYTPIAVNGSICLAASDWLLLFRVVHVANADDENTGGDGDGHSKGDSGAASAPETDTRPCDEIVRLPSTQCLSVSIVNPWGVPLAATSAAEIGTVDPVAPSGNGTRNSALENGDRAPSSLAAIFESVHRYATRVLTSALAVKHVHDCADGGTSVLLVGTQGAGKSALVSRVVLSVSKEADCCVRTVPRRATVGTVPPPDSTCGNDERNSTMLARLNQILGALGCPAVSAADSSRGVLVVWDDLGPMVTSKKAENMNTSDTKRALLLRQVTSLARRAASINVEVHRSGHRQNQRGEHEASFRLALIGAGGSSSQLSDVSVVVARPPGFDYVLPLPRLTEPERCLLLHMLVTQFSAETPSSRFLPRDSGLAEKSYPVDTWCMDVARITAGRTAQDLASIVRRLGALVPSTATVGVPWKDTLRVVAAEPPAVLRAIETIIPAARVQSAGGQEPKGAAGWASFGGYAQLRTTISRYTSGVGPCPRGVAVEGDRGCGKSLLSLAVAAECGMNVIALSSTELLSKWLGETEATIRQLFACARAAAPCAIVVDEFEAIACRRGGGDESGLSTSLQGRVLSTLLNELDGVSSSGVGAGRDEDSAVMLVVTCPSLQLLDEALLRPGRLDIHCRLGRPTIVDLQGILEVRMRGLPLAADVDLEVLAEILAARGATGADCRALCDATVTSVVRATIEASGEGEIIKEPCIAHKDFMACLASKTGRS